MNDPKLAETSSEFHEMALAEIVDEYNAIVISGKTPDIQELSSRLPGGEQVVREVLESLQIVNQMSQESLQPDPSIPRKLGEFEILEEIGRGGMGIVFRARQSSLDRIVALKILPLAASLDKKQLKRFQVETHSASILQHPNIVAIYGTGCDQGIHYYAMQYIRGRSLDEYLQPDEESKNLAATADAGAQQPVPVSRDRLISLDLTTPEIVALIHDAAKALQHAHELGVVHRDIKPSNLLLDEARKIWVTDFGLAQMEDRGTLTLTGDFVGTLRYMSPEQALGGSIPIDHRTDIYSLGATLFELLTRRPLVSGREKIQLLKAIGNMEINFPTGKNRIPRDLETIILKATARERDARYPSAAALAEDLQHFLNHRPIAARRPGLALRISKWAVRNPMMSLVAGSLPILFLIGLAIYNMAISAQKEQVELALQKAQQNENHALLEAQKANTVSEIMQQMVSSANPDQTKGSEYTVRQLLDDLSESLFERLADQPEVAVTLRSTIGNAYRRLGSPERAQNHLQIALDYHVNHRATPVVLAQKYADLAWNYAALQDYAQAVQLARSAVSIHDQLADPSLESVQALWCLQHCLTYKGEYAEADSTADKAIRLAKSMNPVPPTLANVTHDLAQSKTRQGQVAAAIALATEAIELHQQLHGKHHPETGWGFESLARAYQARADFAQAAAAYGSALEIFTENYPPEHKSVRVTLQRLEESLVAAGELERAESVRRSRRRNLFELVLSKSTGTDASLLDYLLEAKSYLAAGELVMSMPEIFDSPAEALRALDILGRYRQALPTSLDFNAAELEKYQKTAQALLDLVIRQCPDEPMMLNNVAWNLLVFADANLRRPADAVRFAERATELKADTGAYWNTLGLAYLRSGREQEAISALTRSQSFETSDEYDTVLLAIAFGRLGDQPKYEEHLKATQQRYARRKQKIEELDLFLAEAESLHAQFSNSVD